MTRRGEDGAGVVMALALVALLVTAGTVAGALVAVLDAHHRVEAAADLAALGGAGVVGTSRDPCTVADDIASRNGAVSESCNVRGSEVWVVVSVQMPQFLGGRLVRARARAGPVDQPTLPSTLATSMRRATRSGFSRGTL